MHSFFCFVNFHIVFLDKNFNIIEKHKMIECENAVSGGNAISLDNRFECVSVRGEDYIYVYEINFQGKLKFAVDKSKKKYIMVVDKSNR